VLILDIRTAGKKAKTVIEKLKINRLTLALAESCTCGLVSSLLAKTPGVSSVFWGSYICYKQEAKVSMLDLDNDKLEKEGLVCCETASSMACMALQKSGADIAASVTGLAGPGTDGRAKVGTVFIAVIFKGGQVKTFEYHFTGSRNKIRYRAAIKVMEAILEVFPEPLKS